MQESYTFKVRGSSPLLPTMKEEISEFYKAKGYIAVYIAINKEPRRVATLRKNDKNIKVLREVAYSIVA